MTDYIHQKRHRRLTHLAPSGLASLWYGDQERIRNDPYAHPSTRRQAVPADDRLHGG
jgi:hypothetical protein